MKEKIRQVAGIFFDVTERESTQSKQRNVFFNVIGRPESEFPQVTAHHAGAWRASSDDNLPDVHATPDGFGTTPEEDQKLGSLWRDFLDASRKRVIG